MASSSSASLAAEKKHWWLSNRKIVEKYVKDARTLIATHEHAEISSALNLLDAALAVSPRFETALELKARSLLYLRRFKEVADMLQDHIPSFKMVIDESSGSSDNSSQQLSRDRVKLLSGSSDDSSAASGGRDASFKCFSVSDLKKKVLAGLCKNCEKEGQWRYLILGQACCHLGLMEDAIVLLQTGKRLATAAHRRRSVSWSEDSFSSFSIPSPDASNSHNYTNSAPTTSSESETVTHLLNNTKLLLRRRTAALAALGAGLHSEAIRHFTKILDGRRSIPHSFMSSCYVHRASAYQAAGRIAESIADLNRALALDPASISALSARATLLETVRSIPDCLRDLEHLKLLYDAILRDRKLPGPAWKPHRDIRYRDVAGNLRVLVEKIQAFRQKVVAGEACNVDYYGLIGLRRGCSRSELERAHLMLCLRHRPDKSMGFVDRCEFPDDRDVDVVKDQARMSALLLYRMLQNGYSSLMASIMEEEAAEKQRKRAAVEVIQVQLPTPIPVEKPKPELEPEEIGDLNSEGYSDYSVGIELPEQASVFQGVFCRDIAVVGNLLSQTGFNRTIPVKYEALSC